MENTMPRVLFTAPRSGSGKTLITCGMIEVLKRRGISVTSFKCGPDFIDPMFHREVLGIPSGNLDTFFTESERTRYLLWNKAKHVEITILEGAMGYYDGLGGTSERASTYEVGKVTKTPAILIVDGKGASVSLAAVIKGMLEFRKDHGIVAVILNRISPSYYERLKELIELECNVTVLGYIPELGHMTLPSRHLGLCSPKELVNFWEWMQELAETIEQTIDVNALLELARAAEYVTGQVPQLPHVLQKVRVAVARDEAFSFYYEENLELLSNMGAELVFFSPLHGEGLPKQIDGLILGGGYPENYADELERAITMRTEIQAAVQSGMPCLAECGGFLYLQQTLEGIDGQVKTMAGALKGSAYRTKKLCRFGYLEAKNQTAGVFGKAGQSMRGHEFHYWDCTENGSDFVASKAGGKQSYTCMKHTSSYAVGFPHFYYYSNPEMPYQFLMACASFRAGKNAKLQWDSIAKPIDSLGLLEDYIVKIAKIEANVNPDSLQKRALLIFCGDHGVVAEGVTQTGREVTQIVSENFAKGCSTVNIMAEVTKTKVFTIDIGMDTPFYPTKELLQGVVVDRKIAKGSGNIAKEPAMTLEACKQAIQIGSDAVRELKEKGYRMIATGEMGIGNTTPTSVLAALFLNLEPKDVTGKGAGLSAEALERKCNVVASAVNRIKEKGYCPINNPLELLAEAGGYEIAGMAGAFLGGVNHRIPIVIDGAISAVAALVASRIDGRVPDYVLASHESEEITGKLALQELGIEAMLHGRMCLGEGTGAVALFPLLDLAMEIYQKMGTFQEYEILPYTRFEDTHQSKK